MGRKKGKKKLSKEEKLKLALEKQKNLKRLELHRELDLIKLNKQKMDSYFNKILLDVKLPLLHKQIKMAWKAFNRLFDKEFVLLENMCKYLDDVNECMDRNNSAYAENVDILLEHMSNTYNEFEADYNKQVTALMKRRDETHSDASRGKEEGETTIGKMIFQMTAQVGDHIWRFKGEAMVREDEEMRRLEDELGLMSMNKEDDFSAIWDNLKRVFETYWKSTSAHRKVIAKRKRKDLEITAIIEKQAEETIAKDAQIRKLRSKLMDSELADVATHARKYAGQYQTGFKKLRINLENAKRKDGRQLHTLVERANRSEERLVELRDKGEAIMRLVQFCRPFETQREKVAALEKSVIVLEDHPNCEELMTFWKKVSKIDESRYRLMEEKLYLESENKLIKRILWEQQQQLGQQRVK